MNGSELVSLVSMLSYGRSRTNAEERALNLQFLNMANLELWLSLSGSQSLTNVSSYDLSRASAQNATSYVAEEGGYFSISPPSIEGKTLMSVNAIFDKNNKLLTQCAITDSFTFEEDRYSFRNAKYYFKDTSNLKNLKFICFCNPPAIVDTEDEITHIPKVFQHLLVNGALYYLTVSTFGSLDKVSIQLSVWENAKKLIGMLNTVKTVF